MSVEKWESPCGRVVLYCGDCLEVLPTIGNVDAVVTDPPYGIGIASNPVRQRHEKREWDNTPAEKRAIEMILRYSNEQIIWGGNYFSLPPSRGFLVWNKLQPESFSLAMCEQAWWSEDANAKMFTKSVTSYHKEHPTQKPVDLMEWCISYIKGGVVCDPYMGSGTTGVAAVKLGRRFIGIEKEPVYFEIAKRRIMEALGMEVSVNGVKQRRMFT